MPPHARQAPDPGVGQLNTSSLCRGVGGNPRSSGECCMNGASGYRELIVGGVRCIRKSAPCQKGTLCAREFGGTTLRIEGPALGQRDHTLTVLTRLRSESRGEAVKHNFQCAGKIQGHCIALTNRFEPGSSSNHVFNSIVWTTMLRLCGEIAVFVDFDIFYSVALVVSDLKFRDSERFMSDVDGEWQGALGSCPRS